jgi:hypothetical protein
VADAIRAALDQAEPAAGDGRGADAWVDGYDWTAMAGRLADAYFA